jgi:hypothetical protein
MQSAGYSLIAGGRRSFRIPLHDALQRVRESVDWQLQKLLYRV